MEQLWSSCGVVVVVEELWNGCGVVVEWLWCGSGRLWSGCGVPSVTHMYDVNSIYEYITHA